MTRFVEMEILAGDNVTSSRREVVTVNTDNILFLQACKYESPIQGLKKEGTQVYVRDVGPMLVPYEYQMISAQLMAGASVLGGVSN